MFNYERVKNELFLQQTSMDIVIHLFPLPSVSLQSCQFFWCVFSFVVCKVRVKAAQKLDRGQNRKWLRRGWGEKAVRKTIQKVDGIPDLICWQNVNLSANVRFPYIQTSKEYLYFVASKNLKTFDFTNGWSSWSQCKYRDQKVGTVNHNYKVS